VRQLVKARDGRKLAVESLGAPEGKPVFLLHGTPGAFIGPRPRGSILYRQGIRLIGYNRPGYADSDRLQGRKVAAAAADVEDIADFFSLKRFSVVGRSGGAPHALACAALLPDRVTCAAALCSLAPYDAEGLDWTEGMAASNVKAYREASSVRAYREASGVRAYREGASAEADREGTHPEAEDDGLSALIATLNQHVRELRQSSEGLLRSLSPELDKSDNNVIGDIALRRIIAETHAEAVRSGIDGWVDDVLALGSPDGWGFKLRDIALPVLLWHGQDDKFSPVGHALWLKERIAGAELDVRPSLAHFDAVNSLPGILSWVLDRVSEELEGGARGRYDLGPERVVMAPAG
jgi:pimeloyl-ACP methyl ester carboxylesterase